MKKITIILLFLIILCSSCSVLTNSNQTNENIVKFGVITDIQGDTTNLDYFTGEFNKAEIDALLILGDLNDMNHDINETDYEEIYSVLEIINNNFNKTIFVMPGNHESKEDYYKALNLFDLTDLSDHNNLKFESMNILSVPGYHLADYTNPNGFLFDNVMDFHPMKDCLPEPEADCNQGLSLLVAHGPPKGTNANSIDAIVTEGTKSMEWNNVGNQQINELILNKNINFGVFGHIHEAGMKAVDINDEFVPENKWSTSLFLNPGPATAWQMNNDDVNKGIFSKGSVAILKIDTENKKARYEIVKVE